MVFVEGYNYVGSPNWQYVKFIDDVNSRELLSCRMPRVVKTKIKVENCCFRSTTLCEADKIDGKCQARDKAYKNRAGSKRKQGSSDRPNRKFQRMLEQADARKQLDQAYEDKRQPCKRWLAGFCLRGKCGKKHGSAVESKKIECASVEGSKNYEAYLTDNGNAFVCHRGEDCIYSHTIVPAE